ncbi:hypothetical protein H0H93_012291, partial [Arthromyces matolae]
PSTRRLPRCYRPSDAALAFISHSANPAEYLSNIQAKMDFIEKYMEFCVSLNKWKISWQEAYEVTSSVNEGIAVSIAHMYGWNIRDMMSSTPYGPMHRLKNSRIELVTPEDHERIKPEIEKSLANLAAARERRRRGAAYSNNRYAVEQHLQRLRSHQPHVVLPSLEVFRRLPVIQLLQGTFA